MNLEILICTTEQRLEKVDKVLLPTMGGVSYLISCQYSGTDVPEVPSKLQRVDVRFVTLQGKGLCRNRNNALSHSQGDILLLADDDEVLNIDAIPHIVHDFSGHPQWSLIQYRMEGTGKQYPAQYVSSVEMAMRREVALAVRFDERFGIGSEFLACGEEDIFVTDACQAGFTMGTLGRVVCRIKGETTGTRFLQDTRVQRAKGAVFCKTRGVWYAYYKCTREALGWMFRSRVNPLPLIKNMFWGIKYVRS